MATGSGPEGERARSEEQNKRKEKRTGRLCPLFVQLLDPFELRKIYYVWKYVVFVFYKTEFESLYSGQGTLYKKVSSDSQCYYF